MHGSYGLSRGARVATVLARMKHDHKVGRPARVSEHSTSNITLRLTDEERDTVDAHVAKTGKARAVLIREAMEAYGLFVPPRKRS